MNKAGVVLGCAWGEIPSQPPSCCPAAGRGRRRAARRPPHPALARRTGMEMKALLAALLLQPSWQEAVVPGRVTASRSRP